MDYLKAVFGAALETDPALRGLTVQKSGPELRLVFGQTEDLPEWLRKHGDALSVIAGPLAQSGYRIEVVVDRLQHVEIYGFPTVIEIPR